MTDNKIVWFAVILIFWGFIGPGLLSFSPPIYFPIKQDTYTEFSDPSLVSELTSVSSDVDKQAKTPDKEILQKNTEEKGLTPLSNLAETTQKTEETPPKTEEMHPETGAKPPKIKKKETVRDEPNINDPQYKQAKPKRKVEPIIVSRILSSHIKESHILLVGAEQKESFIKIVLPLIIEGNNEIGRRRDAINRAYRNDNRTALIKWASFYDIEITDQDNDILRYQVLKRADKVPIPIALAQAAVESGWGTSRFALQGNALFGQWAWRDHAGLRPMNPSNERAVVRSFATLLGSVRAYIHNLNTHSFYQKFRHARASMSRTPESEKTKILVKFLDRYAEIGPAYVNKLENIIRTNDFERFSSAKFY